MSNIQYTRIGDLGMRLEFLNGTIILPNKCGSYVISPGCGSGKTTVIKQIIRENFDKGVLYSASTIEECNLMYQFCKELVEEYNNPNLLKEDDIIVLHSDYKSDGVDNNLWRNNPEKLADKKIVICTHYKLMNEDPNILTDTNFNVITYDDLDRSTYRRAFRSKPVKTVGRVEKTKPRRFVLIDEVPTTGIRTVVVTRNQLLSYALRNNLRMEGMLSEEARRTLSTEMTRFNEVIYREPETFRQFVGTYSSANNKELPEIYKSSNRSSTINDTRTIEQVRLDNEMGSIYDKFPELWSEMETEYQETGNPNPSRKVYISFMNALEDRELEDSSVLLFDGTGDITFKESKVFQVRSLPEKTRKYNSDVKLIKFESSLRRRVKAVHTLEDSLLNSIRSNVDSLEKILKSNSKTLIVTWKNLKEDASLSDESEFIVSSINEKKSLTGLYKSLLESKGFIEGINFDIIHYQSGLDKATNKFIDCDSIVFLGEFHIPNSAVDEFNKIFKTNSSPESYLMYQLVQAVCRTRIRKHSGEPVNIYYTSDWNDRIMEALASYLTQQLDNHRDPVALELNDPLHNIREPYKSEVYKLDSEKVLPGVVNAIVNGQPMNYRVSLSSMYKAVPRGNCQIRSYNKLLKLLKSVRIDVTITTNQGKAIGTSEPNN